MDLYQATALLALLMADMVVSCSTRLRINISQEANDYLDDISSPLGLWWAAWTLLVGFSSEISSSMFDNLLANLVSKNIKCRRPRDRHPVGCLFREVSSRR